MKTPIYVRELTSAELNELNKGLRSKEAFRLRRSQILIASTQGRNACQIAKELKCASQTVRNAIKAFNARGIESLQEGSSRPKTVQPVIDAAKGEQLKSMLQHSPRQYAKNSSLWTLPLLAQVCFEQGLSETLLSSEAIRQAVGRLGIKWKRAKHWISSPDPEYARKKSDETV